MSKAEACDVVGRRRTTFEEVYLKKCKLGMRVLESALFGSGLGNSWLWLVGKVVASASVSGWFLGDFVVSTWELIVI